MSSHGCFELGCQYQYVETRVEEFQCCVCHAGCLQLLDTLPQSVYRVCDLLMVLTTRNGVTWQTEVLTSLISQVLVQFVVTR